ncbi:MAG: lactate utilization protein LutB domain-containing protein, partial [Ancrocorticia populi]
KVMAAGNLIAGPDHKIGHIPLPVVSNWTFVRDVPAPPTQTFRDWWKDREQDSTGKPAPTPSPATGPTEPAEVPGGPAAESTQGETK